MKKLTLVLATVAVSGSVYAAPALPVFEFRGIVAGKPADMSQFVCATTPDPLGDVNCVSEYLGVAGINYVRVFSFHNSKMVATSLMVKGDADARILEDSLITKYGAPSNVSKKTKAKIWNLRTGNMTLDSASMPGRTFKIWNFRTAT